MMPGRLDDETLADAKGNTSFYKLKRVSEETIKDAEWLEGSLDDENEPKDIGSFAYKRFWLGRFMQLHEVQIFWLSLVALNGIFIGITTDHDIPGTEAIEMVFP